ncbi:MAG: zf-HC2 domain-containing protein [Candidatus Eisenbacteria bacterium]|jgi:hypothetical protein|nr:zf-HC2 domain-containing protein [Candidatus Eisenbacteria bacterium]
MRRILDLHAMRPEGCTDHEAGSLLAAYEWGLLASAEEDAFEAHLIGCAACAQELSQAGRVGDAIRSRGRRRSRVWIPIGAAAAAAAILTFSHVLSPPQSGIAVTSLQTDTVSSPARQATMSFELSVPSQTRFSYDLSVPGTG